MIRMRQRAVPNSRRSTGSAWLAECEIDGIRYAVLSRHGAPNELARKLVAAGVEDQPVRINHAGLRGDYSTGSLFEMAKWTYHGAAARKVRWRPGPNRPAVGAASGKKRG